MYKCSAKNMAKLIPQREKNGNKTQSGRVLIIAGSKGMWGAAVLSATSAGRVGAGYTSLMTSVRKFPTVKHPDFLTKDISEFLKNSSSNRVTQEFLKIYSAIAVGPGLGFGTKTQKILKVLKNLKPVNVVLDAGALHALALSIDSNAKVYTKLPATWVITPHEGELARILNRFSRVTASQIARNRLKYVTLAREKLGCIVLLKGHHTLIANSNGEIFEIQTGNAALAKAGTGDVLTGIIAGFLAQGLKPIDAACAGATLHGFCADEWVKSGRDYLGLLASDLVEGLPSAISKMRCLQK